MWRNWWNRVGGRRRAGTGVALRSGVQAHYRLDGSLADTGGSSRTLVNGGGDATYSASGLLGSSLSSHGTGTAISGLSIPASSFTLSFWVLFTGTNASVSATQTLATNAGNFTASLLRINRTISTAAPNTNSAAVNSLLADVWHHVVLVKNGTAGELFVDNVSRGTFVADATATITGWTLQAVSRVLVDEFAVWDRALSAAEVASLYNGGSGNDPTA